jgi:oxygen-independent coproporphyrinogen-3 oxidase
MVPRDIALYIHVPFCRRKCSYCSFVSYAYREADIPSYLQALQKELARRAGGELVRSVYFGGGTPSLLTVQQLGDLIATIGSIFRVNRAAEISIEANPGTVNREYLAAIRELGVNRLSLGVQSLQDSELERLGRIHTADEAREAIRQARDAGFDNLNIDLIYGLPGQTLSDWRRTLDEAIVMRPEHLSLYALTLEEDTPMREAIEAASLPGLDPDAAADQYELAGELLAANGYGHYEISNWATAGRECRHNLTYWRNLPYIGAGVAAHSCCDGHRLANTGSLDEYLAGFSGESWPAPEMDEEISPELALAETVILGLRLCEGIDPDDIYRRSEVDITARYRRPIEAMVGAGLLEQPGGRLRLTPRGRLLSNEVFWRFLPGE